MSNRNVCPPNVYWKFNLTSKIERKNKALWKISREAWAALKWPLNITSLTIKYTLNWRTLKNESSFNFLFGTLNLSCQGLKKILEYHSLSNSSWEPQSTEDPLDWGLECPGLWREWISRPIESMDGAVSVCWVNVGAADTQWVLLQH